MEYIDIKYILKRMIKVLWIAALAGFVLAGAYSAKKLLLDNRGAADVQEHTEERYSFENYQGDYLTYPETERVIILPYRFKEDIVSQLTNTNVILADYSRRVGELMADRIKSGSFSNGFYQHLLNQFPELRKDQKVFNILKLEDEMLTVGTDRNSVLWITIKAPLFLLEESDCEYTDEQLCAYRDALYDMIAKEMEETEMFSDLSVTLHRVQPTVEESVSEQNLIMNNLEDEEILTKSNLHGLSRKRLVLFFALGFAAVEGIVFLFAVFNNKVKSVQDFTRNTDVEVLDCITCDENNPDWSLVAVKTAASLDNKDELTILCEGEKPDWDAGLSKALTITGKDIAVNVMPTFELKPENLMQLTGRKLLLTVEENKSDYGTLRKLSDNLRQVHAVVIGAVVIERKKRDPNK